MKPLRIVEQKPLKGFDPEFYRCLEEERLGWKWHNVELSRPKTYDGENIWNGEWFAAPFYPGPRAVVVLRPKDFPPIIDSNREQWPTTGRLGMDFWEGYKDESRPLVLDGILATRDKEGNYDFSTITKGMHLPPTAVLLADDLYSWKVFKAGAGSQPFTERRKKLRAFADQFNAAIKEKCESEPKVVLTNYRRIDSRKTFKKTLEQCLAVEGFGMILRRDCPYRSGRNGNILKIKAK